MRAGRGNGGGSDGGAWEPLDSDRSGAGDEHVERARMLAPQIEAVAEQIEQDHPLARPE